MDTWHAEKMIAQLQEVNKSLVEIIKLLRFLTGEKLKQNRNKTH